MNDTPREPCGGAQYAILPLFRRGTQFQLRFVQSVEPINWTTYTLTLSLDSPNGTVRHTLVSGPDNPVSDGGTTVTFTQPAQWSVDNLDTDGNWRWYLWETPAGGQPHEIGRGELPVFTRRAGP